MASKKLTLMPKASLPFKTGNKHKRENFHINRKKAQDKTQRDKRFSRRREEDKDPRLREERVKQNVPLTLERKRVWDEVDRDTGDELGISVDVERLKRQKLDEEAANAVNASEDVVPSEEEDQEDRDSMIDPASEASDAEEAGPVPPKARHMRTTTERATSPTRSTTSTNLDLTPEALASVFRLSSLHLQHLLGSS